MKRVRICLSMVIFSLLILFNQAANAQILPSNRVVRSQPDLNRARLPDLDVYVIRPNATTDKIRLTVIITNNGDPKFETATAKAPFKVWLRVWKPTDEKSAEGPTSGKNSFLWGGVLTVTSDIRVGEHRDVTFEIQTVPPGGWNTKCAVVVGCYRTPESMKDPLRWRALAIVDTTDAVHESNEANNTYLL